MSNIMKKLIINDGEFEIVDESARNQIEDITNNLPYVTYDEDVELQLPVTTINDSETAANSTWSSQKISAEIETVDDKTDTNASDIDSLESAISALQSSLNSFISSVNSSISSLNSALVTVRNAQKFKVGDKFTAGGSNFYIGVLYNSRTVLTFLIPMPKQIDSAVHGVTVDSASEITVREVDGDTLQATTTISSVATVALSSLSDGGVALSLTKKSGNWGGSQNTQMVYVVLNNTFKMTFTS